MDNVTMGFLGSLGAAGATAAGALPIFISRKMSQGYENGMLGFAAGVMLAASFFSLIIPALDAGKALYNSMNISVAIVVAGILVGAGVIWLVNELVPHEHPVIGREGPKGFYLSRVWLFVLAITIHNFPEGLAIGVGFGTGDVAHGTSLAIGIGLQDIPEGLAVAVALMIDGHPRWFAFVVAMLTGLVEPIGGLIGALAVSVSEVMLPWGLAFAAGAMLYVINHEIIPETHSKGHSNVATGGLIIGLCIMLALDVLLG